MHMFLVAWLTLSSMTVMYFWMGLFNDKNEEMSRFMSFLYGMLTTAMLTETFF